MAMRRTLSHVDVDDVLVDVAEIGKHRCTATDTTGFEHVEHFHLYICSSS